MGNKGVQKQRLNKDLGLFLLVESNKESKYVFYKAYYTKEEIYNAVEHDKELHELMAELKPESLVITIIMDEEKKE